MPEVAEKKTAEPGIKNFETEVVNASEIPFDDNTFDAISCRFGTMFLPDMQQAAGEMLQVLKPGRRISTSVWNIAEKNYWVAANPDLMEDLFKQAGFKNISITEVEGKLNTGSANVYWNRKTEAGAPFAAAQSKADDQQQAKIKKEVLEIN